MGSAAYFFGQLRVHAAFASALSGRAAWIPVRVRQAVDQESDHSLSRGGGRAEFVAGGSDGAARAGWRVGELERDQGAQEGLLRALHAAADGDVRGVRLAGPDGVLRVLGSVAGADGDPD